MACPPKGGIYPANGPHRGQYTSHCATLSLSFFVHPSLAVLQFVSLFLSVFLFFAFSSFIFRARLPVTVVSFSLATSQFSLTDNDDNRNENNRLWRVFPISKPTKMTRGLQKRLFSEGSIVEKCILHEFRPPVSIARRSFIFGGGAGEGWANENIYYDFFAWGFVFEKINFKN